MQSGSGVWFTIDMEHDTILIAHATFATKKSIFEYRATERPGQFGPTYMTEMIINGQIVNTYTHRTADEAIAFCNEQF